MFFLGPSGLSGPFGGLSGLDIEVLVISTAQQSIDKNQTQIIIWLVVSTPEKILVSWDDYSQYIYI
jgi:hypothetical protein